MNIEALHQAIRVLREVEAKALPFHMASWAISLPFDSEPDCGTASCAAGWCARDAWFNAQGFTIGKRSIAGRGLVPILNTRLGELYNWDACEAMFGLTEKDTHFLFFTADYSGPCVDIMPRHVIEHIETLLAQHAAPAVKHETPARELVPA